MRFRFPQIEPRQGPAARTRHLAIGYPDHTVARDVHIEIDHGARVGVVGDNGQGKTNWLESIAVLASARSFRTPRLQDAVAFGEQQATVRGSVRESEEIVRELQVIVSGSSKTLLINGKKETAARYQGNLHAVVFNADEV